MADITSRPFSKNYSGLTNQTVVGAGIVILCVTWHEFMKRKRRGKPEKYSHIKGLGSVETWEFGYLYQGRSWAKNPSPPTPRGLPLSWVHQVIGFPEDKLNELRGIDATLYIRFLRGCFWFTFLHSLTTFVILFPIHTRFSEHSVDPKSMTRASISSLVLTDHGKSLLWIHVCLLFWLTLTWIGNLLWICKGAFHMRVQKLEEAATRAESAANAVKDSQYHPHPHPQYPFQDPPSLEHEKEGLRLRTVMVSNIPPQLRSEKDLEEYFQYYMSRRIDKPSMGLTSSTQPGLIHKSAAFLFNRAKHLPTHLPHTLGHQEDADDTNGAEDIDPENVPVISRVVVVRKMTELASLLERREEILRRLETAHLKLAKKTLIAVRDAMEHRLPQRRFFRRGLTMLSDGATPDVENGHEGSVKAAEHMELLIRALSPHVDEFGLRDTSSSTSTNRFKQPFNKAPLQSPQGSDTDTKLAPEESYPPVSQATRSQPHKTIWESLLEVPRKHLDAYQPLVRLHVLFRGKTVPAIDYYTAKLGLLTSLITENRSKAISDYHPVATAFVTFSDPADARKACKYLAVHPNNPMACLVTMAPGLEDLDWIRVMKSPFSAELFKDWIVNIGVWAFTFFWLFPVSFLVGLVSIQKIGRFWPKLKAYLENHPWQEEVIQSFLPTFLIAVLTILIPLILLLIGKKAHTFTTLSAMHDIIMSRYYKFLVVNVLVFFCVGTAALSTFLSSFRAVTDGTTLVKVVADSFPTAGPFFVGWLIFTMAIHAGFELALFGLPLLVYPSTRSQVTPRKRAIGIRPRTFNYYYWLPNHLLVIHILLLFILLNPLIIPFSTLYFFVETGVVKNQLLHVYAKNYEGNGQHLLIRIVRYSLDGLTFAQAVFLVYMVVLKKNVHIGFAAVLIVFTFSSKILMTRMCRAQFEHDDIAEAQILCGTGPETSESDMGEDSIPDRMVSNRQQSKFFGSWRRPVWFSFSYSTVRQRRPVRRQPNPFGPHAPPFSRIASPVGHTEKQPTNEVAAIETKPRATDSNDGPRLSTEDLLSTVVKHAPLVAWDDESHIDLPYDNPYYMRSIRNVLWLPRDPFGVLDLDDTVDLRLSITSEPTAGQLGTWLGIADTTDSPRPVSQSSMPESFLQAPTAPSFRKRQYTGLEEINLPSGIAVRVQDLDKEDVEDARERRPSFFSRTSSGGDKSSISRTSSPRLPFRAPTDALGVGYNTYAGNDRRLRASSFLTTMERPPQRRRSATESGTPPDMHAQADFARSHLSVVSPSIPEETPSKNVTTLEALVQEVIAEEGEALSERLKEEGAEGEATGYKSWLPSWSRMFRRGS